ncbi:MAG: competence protein CoiA family protein [Pseudomonadota bacterium]
MDSPHKTGYAIKNGLLVHVSEVPRGLSCGCTCVVCGNKLIARKGHQRRHHFAHSTETNCLGAAETALHLVSKELVGELSRIALPSYNFTKTKKIKSGAVVSHQQPIAKGGEAKITAAIVESACNGFVPDVILDCGLKKLIVEIAVTHKVDRDKMRHIRKHDLPAIEIHLDLSDALLSRDDLRRKLRDDISSKKWLFHPEQRIAERLFFSKLRTAIRDQKRSSANKRPKPPDFQSNPLPLTYGFNARAPSHGFNEYEKAARRFYNQHSRYPSMDECLTLWPHLWKKPEN